MYTIAMPTHTVHAWCLQVIDCRWVWNSTDCTPPTATMHNHGLASVNESWQAVIHKSCFHGVNQKYAASVSSCWSFFIASWALVYFKPGAKMSVLNPQYQNLQGYPSKASNKCVEVFKRPKRSNCSIQKIVGLSFLYTHVPHFYIKRDCMAILHGGYNIGGNYIVRFYEKIIGYL